MKNKLTILFNDINNLFLIGISYLIPKDNKLWLFGAWFGESYVDNSKYLFEYVNQFQPYIKAIWITKNKDMINLISAKGYSVYMFNSPKGMYYTWRAKVGIVSASCRDINSCPNKKMILIWLWHGTPLKRIKNDAELLNQLTSIENKSNLYDLYNYIFRKNENYEQDMFIATSREVQNKISSAFRVNISQVEITGYPRNDAFFQKIDKGTPLVKKIIRFKKDNIKILIYMPTFRNWGAFDLGKFLASNLHYINDNLKRINSVLLIKLHHGDMKQIKDLDLKEFPNIIPINDISIQYDIYPILKLTDILITDYSSIYFDYLILDHPVIFAPFDFDEYQQSYRTFYYDYNEVTPGEKAKNWGEVMAKAEKIISGMDSYQELRQKVNIIFNDNFDGNNSKRVFDAIVKKYYRKGNGVDFEI